MNEEGYFVDHCSDLHAMLTQTQIEWVLDFLSGSGPLGAMLCERKAHLDFSSARIFPAAAHDSDFRWGLPIEDRFNGGMSDFVCSVKRKLKDGHMLCLFRECDFKRHDPCMEHEVCPMMFVGEDILYVLDAASEDDQIRDIIHTANGFMLMLLMSSEGCKFQRGDCVTYAQIEAHLPSLEGIAVGVFDDEGVCYIPVLPV